MNYEPESRQIAELVERADHILVVSHANPDADAIAAILSFRHVFGHDSRNITLALGTGSIPATLEYLPSLDEIRPIESVDLAAFDLFVLLDCADQDRIGDEGSHIVELGKKGAAIINIDHHVTNSRFGHVNLVDPEAAATCEILTLLYQDLGATFDSDLSTMLLTGIQGDTLGLRTPSTTSRTLRATASLVEHKADLDSIVDYLFRIRPFSTLKLWGEALSKASFNGVVVWTEITPEMLERAEADESEGEGIVNFLAGTQGARAGALLYRRPDGWRVSMRSLSDAVDVAELASLFGGGGHSRAAGCSLNGGDEARDEFLATITERIARTPLPAPGGN